jgi:hypothetical protein
VSGGRWHYQRWPIQELASSIKDWRLPLARFIEAVAESEQIVDWSESGDTVRRREDGSGAERDLYDLWLKTFSEVYDDG